MSNNTQSTSDGESERDERLESVIAEYIRASEAGNAPSRRNLLEQYPELAVELNQFLKQRDNLNRMADPIREFGDDLFQAIGPGQQLSYVGNYELLEEIARGGMGIVYKARQKTLGRIVAVKMIVAGRWASEQDVQRFRSEAQAAASLQHPNIVSIHEVGQHEGWHYFSMDYVEGNDLSTILRLNLLSDKKAAEYVRQMAEAIHYAHQQGILHRDLKPSNILIDSHDQIRITDFGLAMRVEGDQGLTQTGQIVGTPSYMPPEQAQSKRALIGPASDVYALGAILYECLTGRPPFRAETVIKTINQVIHAEAASPRTLNAAIPRDLETICLKCLEKEPHRRYGTAQLLADDLERFLKGEPIVARQSQALDRSIKWMRRHPMAAALLIAITTTCFSIVWASVSFYYNTQLQSSNEKLHLSNQLLEGAKATLETRNEQLSVASSKLGLAMDDVKTERAMARRHLYASRMALIQVALQNGQTARIVELLRSLIPESEQQDDLRGFEWHHLWSKYHGEQFQLVGHSGPVTCLACSPDQRWIASGSADHSIRIWDASTGKQVHHFIGHTNEVTDLTFSRDNQFVVSCSSDTTVKTWSMETAIETGTLIGHTAPVVAVSLSSDDSYVASGDSSGVIQLRERKTGEIISKWTHSESVIHLAFHPQDNQLAISSTKDSRIYFPFETLSKALGNTQSSTRLVYGKQGERLIGGLVSKKKTSTISTFESEGGRRLYSLSIEGVLKEVAYSNDGSFIAAGMEDQSIKVYESTNGGEIATFHAGDAIRSLVFSRDGNSILVGTEGRKILGWTIPGREVKTIQNSKSSYSVFFIDDVTLAAGTGKISLWDVATGAEISNIAGGAKKRFAVHKDWIVGASTNKIVHATTGETIVSLQDAENRDSFGIGEFAISNDGKRLAGASGLDMVHLWDTATGSLIRTFEMQSMAASVAFSPDGELIASGSAWFSGASNPGKLKTHAESCSWQIWTEKSVERLFFKKEKFGGGIWDMKFSPDGRLLAVACGRYEDKGTTSGRIGIWDTSTWRIVHDLRGHTGSVWSIAFNSSGTRLASGSGYWQGGGGQAKIWDVNTGLEVLTLADDKDPVYGVAFSPDGNRLATANRNGLVRVWEGKPIIISLPKFAPLTGG